MQFAEWVRDPMSGDGCVMETVQERVFVVRLDRTGYANLFLCINGTTGTAWECRSDQLGAWFDGNADIRALPVEPLYARAFAHRLDR